MKVFTGMPAIDPRITASVDYGVEAEKILRSILAPSASNDRWAHKLHEHPEIASAAREFEYQLASAEDRGRRLERAERARRRS